MSTLVAQTISNGTVSTSSANVIQGSAKAWVNFNGTGTVSTNQTIRASYNVSSIFKNATGDYTINFTNALTDANYAWAGSSQSSSAQTVRAIFTNTSTTPTTTALRVQNSNYVSAEDPSYASVVVFR